MNFEMSWTGKREHRNLSFELAHASHPEFCALALPLLRSALHESVLAAQAHPSPEIGEDHVVWTDGDRTPLIHLGQTFESDDIGESEIQRSRAAVRSFADTARRTAVYLLVHNRDGRDSTYREAIQPDLDALVASGQVERAEIWNRQRLLREAFNGMLRYTFEAIQRKNLSTAPVDTLTQSAPYLPLEKVPYSVSTLIFNQYQLTSVKHLGDQIADPAAEILTRGSGNLFLLTGSFGQGKTTAVARALAQGSTHLLYVAGARISRKEVRSTKDYLQRCIDERELLENFPEKDFSTLRRLVRPVIQRVVSDPELPLITVIDGIDESSFLTTHGGFQQLFNILQEIKVPVVLTMRTELWDQGRDMFEAAFGLPPQRVSPRNREVLRVDLLPWDDDRIGLLIDRYREGLDDAEGRVRLATLNDLLSRGELARIFGDIPRRPLFLRLLLDTVAETGLPAGGTGRARLLHDWALLKLHRDMAAPVAAGGEGRLPLAEGASSVHLAWEAMLQAAAEMVEPVEGVYELTADCSLEKVLHSSERLRRIEDPLGLFLNSLLLPSAPSILGAPLKIRFAHRAFQEFFLAWFSLLHPDKLQESPLPDPVREWAAQIQAEGLIPVEASRAGLPRPVEDAQRTDLEIRVSLEQTGGSARLRFILNSPSGRADVSFLDITGPPIAASPEEFRRALVRKLERLAHGFDVDESPLLREEIQDKLIGIGRDLYKEIFPPEVRSVYRRIRKSVQTLMITTDEPWIPWELIRPYDAGDPADPVDDDFLCLQFEMTRWMIGRPPVREARVERLACFCCDETLPSALQERDLVAGLAHRHPEIKDASPAASTSGTVKTLLSEGGLQLIHFVGHGTFDPAQPNEAGLKMPDGIFLRPVDLHGPLQTRIAKDRPLVFLNACRSAQEGWSLTGLGGWAQRWVRDCGCGAFIGPVWAVSDRLAYKFAAAFYNALEGGATFGGAARTARRTVQQIAPGNPAWLAYSVYAHPQGRLAFDSGFLAP